MKRRLFCFITGIVLASLFCGVNAQEKNKVKVKLSGFVSAEAIYDTRAVVASRDGENIFYPKAEELDKNGKDINATSSFNFLSIHSRLRAKTTPYYIWGGNITALMEMDFCGTANDKIGLMRLRHLMLKYTKGKSSLIFGQYWNPMFVPACFPTTSSWEVGAPTSVLARNPQIRFNYNFTDKFRGSLIALSQLDAKSNGPKGKSSEYIRNSGVPEFDMHIEYGNPKKFIMGLVAGTKSLKSRLKNTDGNKVDESIRTYHGMVYAKLLTPHIGYKVEGIYAQNGYNLLLLGGYAVSDIDPQTKEYSYTPISSASVWTEIFSRYDSTFNWGIFAGYTKNLGAKDEIAIPYSKGNIYARGANIANVLKIAPRLVWGQKNFKIMAEINQTFASYGTPDKKLKVQDAKRVGNTRFQLHFKYFF